MKYTKGIEPFNTLIAYRLYGILIARPCPVG